MTQPINYVECKGCDFVMRAEKEAEPVPKREESCPRCGGTEFQFVAR